MLTLWVEALVDAVTIMRIAGHNSAKVAERYVNRAAEAIEGAFKPFETFNHAGAGEDDDQRASATIPATPEDLLTASLQAASLI